MRRPIRTLTLLLAVILPVACGGPPGIKKTGKAVKGEISGVVMKGLVAGATVTAYAYDGRKRGEAVGVATTDTTGSFTLDVSTAEGTLLLEAMSGTYTDEATGKTVPLGDHALDAVVPRFKLGATVRGVQVNPVTTFIAAYTRWRMGPPLGETFDAAFAAATQKVDHHFGGADWSQVVARDLTGNATGSGMSLTDADVAEGLFLSGLSQEARDVSEQLQVADTSVNAAALVDALARDLGADGLFDGHGLNGAQISLYASNGGASAAHYDLSGDTLRADLARAMVAFLASPRNASGLARTDADALLKAVASDGPPAGTTPKPGEYLFATPGRGDIDPPAVTIELPQENDGVRGDTPVKVTAADAKSDIATIAFTDGSQVAQVTVSPTGPHVKEADGVLKAGTLPDGPFTLHAYAVDAAGNRADALRHVVVANQAPTITITSPGDGDTVSGTVHITATAAPNPTSQAALDSFAVVAPSGLTDALPATADLDATWDTTTAPEGAYTVKLEALDQYGSKATATVNVIVDNRPAPVISGQVEVAGLPVRSPLVTVIALDEPTTAYPGGQPIGHIVGTDGGTFHVTLTDENYFGPVAIVASANTTSGSATTYRDMVATPGGLDVSFGAGDQLTLYLPSVADPAGGDWVGVAVSPWSTVADRLARYYAARSVSPLSPADAAQRANEMIAGHFSRGSAKGIFDLSHANFVDPSQPYSGDPWGAYPALADAGLEQLAADLDVGQQPGATSVLTLVRTLTADIADGVFDGQGPGGPVPAVQGVLLDSYTTRNEFALEIDRFVNGVGSAMGLTTLELKQAHLYDDVSVDDREIYPQSEPGHEYDTTPPTIVWTSPAQDGLDAGTNTVDVDVSASDPVLDGTGVASFVVTAPASLAGTDLDTSTGRIHLLIDNSVAPNDGDGVAITVQATDAAGNVTTDTRRFTRPAPTVRIVSVTSAATGVAVRGDVSGAFRIDATGTAGYATRRLVLVPPPQGVNDPAAIGPDTNGSPQGLSVLVDPTGGKMADGLYTFKVEHETIDGRMASDQVQLTVDNAAPALTATLTSLHGTSAQGAIFLPRSGYDAQGNAVGHVSFDYTVGDDVAGVSKVELVDVTGGTVVATDTPGACTGSGCSGTLAVDEPNGAYRFLVRATDGAGNVVTAAPTSLSVDTNDPGFSVAPVLADPKQPDGAGGFWLPKAGADAVGPYGVATVAFTAEDGAPSPGALVSGVSQVAVSLSGTADDGSPLPTVLPDSFPGCSGGCSGTLSTTLRSGDYVLQVAVTDVAGNRHVSTTAFQVHVDAVPPSLTVSQVGWVQAADGSWWVPRANGTTGDVSFDYTTSDDKGGVRAVELLISGQPSVTKALAGCLSAPCSGTITAGLPTGAYTVQVQVADAAGNVTKWPQRTVNVDADPPTFATGPAFVSTDRVADGAGFWLPRAGTDASGAYGQALFDFSVLDPASGADKVVLTATGTQTGAGAVTLTQVETFNGCKTQACTGELAMRLREGSYSLELALYDVAGNVTTSKTWSVRVDTTDPAFSAALTNSNLVNGVDWIGDDQTGAGTGTPRFTYSVQDNSSGITQVRVIATQTGAGSDGTAADTYAAGCVASACAPESLALPLAEGTYDVHLEARDKAGNVSVSRTWTVEVDVQDPNAADQTGAADFADPRDLDYSYTGGRNTYSARPGATAFSDDDASARRTGTSGVPVWWKFEQRLSGTSEADAAPGAGNLPIFRVSATDATGVPNTADSDLEVDYEYAWSNDGVQWNVARAWTPAPATATPGQFFVLASEDMLSADLRRDGLYHRVTFRVRDRALNEATQTFVFRLHLVPAPVAVQVDANYESQGVSDGASLYARTFANGNVHCVFSACSPQDLDNSFSFRVAHAVVYQPFAGYTAVMQIHLGQSVLLERRLRQKPIVTAYNSVHACTKAMGYTDQTGASRTCQIAKAPDPTNGDPPCLDQWGAPARQVVWKDLDQATDAYGGCREDTDSSSASFPVQAYLRDDGGTVVNDGFAAPLNALVVDRGSNTVVPSSSVNGSVYSYDLATGTYDVYYRIPLEGGITPSFLSTTRSDLDPTNATFDAYGVVLQNQVRWKADQSGNVYQVTGHFQNGTFWQTCDWTGASCTGWTTTTERVVRYEEALVWYGDQGSPSDVSSSVAVNITNATTTVPLQRDPLTSQSVDNAAGAEVYGVYHALTETGN